MYTFYFITEKISFICILKQDVENTEINHITIRVKVKENYRSLAYQ